MWPWSTCVPLPWIKEETKVFPGRGDCEGAPLGDVVKERIARLVNDCGGEWDGDKDEALASPRSQQGEVLDSGENAG